MMKLVLYFCVFPPINQSCWRPMLETTHLIKIGRQKCRNTEINPEINKCRKQIMHEQINEFVDRGIKAQSRT